MTPAALPQPGCAAAAAARQPRRRPTPHHGRLGQTKAHMGQTRRAFTLLVVGFLWACASVFRFRADVTATTSVSLEVLTGRESFTRDEVQSIIQSQGRETRRHAPWIFTPA